MRSYLGGRVMGLGLGVSGGSTDYGSKNPDPKRFTIVRAAEYDRATIAMVRYHDCTNYEGHKILVFAGRCYSWLHQVKELDPHFEEGGKLIARFVPTEEGWNAACSFAGRY